ncbi:MAG: MarR family transcriptional regulator, partial [Sphingomonas sp.]
GKISSDKVLASRDQVIAEGLTILTPDDLKILSDIAERVLRDRLENLDHSYRICRLCCHEGCTNCPIDAELLERGVDREA